MTLFNSANTNAPQLIAAVTQGLIIVRNAMDVANSMYAWSSGVSPSDLEAVGSGIAPADAGAILSAIADAHALSSFYNTGLPPGSYPQPPSAYVYGISQRIVIGPRPA